MGVKEYARHRGVSPAAVRKAASEGRIPRRPDGKFDVAEADAKWAANTTGAPKPKRRKAAEPVSEVSDPAPAAWAWGEPVEPAPTAGEAEPSLVADNLTFAQARASKETYLARLRKLEYEEKSGRLVDQEAVRRAQFTLLRTIRDRFLELPDRLADDLAAETDPGSIHELLRVEVRAVLEALSAELRKLTPAEA